MNIPYHQRAVAIIIQNKKILLMHRIKNGKEYYVFPGGTIEDGETPEQTAIREIKEETSLDISLGKLLYEHEDEMCYGYYFLAQNIRGQAQLGGEELDRNTPNNHYALEWVAIDNLPNILIYPPEIAQSIHETYN